MADLFKRLLRAAVTDRRYSNSHHNAAIDA
jgi:hypothetical protein